MAEETQAHRSGGETVDVPLAGKVNKKVAVGAVIGVGLLVVIYYVRKKSSSTASATTAATTTDQYPPDGTIGNPSDPYSTDPATNQTYGDEAVGSGTFGAYGTAAGSYAQDTGVVGYDANGNPVYAPGYQPTNTSTSGVPGPPFSNNGGWSNYVISQIQTTNSNIDIGAFTDAIGLYLSGQPLTPAQKQFVFDAIAIGGDPPVPGTNSYPPQLRSEPSSTSGGGGTVGGGGTSPIPSISGGHVVSVSNNEATVAWSGKNAVRYNVKIVGPGPINGRTNTVPVAKAVYSGLEAGHNYTVFVTPIGSDLHTEGHEGQIPFQTTRNKG